eukprot:COSAG01_NODE_68853_length_263_cov_0.591463_2_plen_25_part_01
MGILQDCWAALADGFMAGRRRAGDG